MISMGEGLEGEIGEGGATAEGEVEKTAGELR
jgi:hypothetical protein